MSTIWICDMCGLQSRRGPGYLDGWKTIILSDSINRENLIDICPQCAIDLDSGKNGENNMNKRTESLQIMLTKAEIDAVDEAAGDVPRSAWARKIILQTLYKNKE